MPLPRLSASRQLPTVMQHRGPIPLPARASLDRADYPASINSAVPSLDDMSLCHKLFANKANFAPASKCDVFELLVNGRGTWKRDMDDKKILEYVRTSLDDNTVESTSRLVLRAIFCTIEEQRNIQQQPYPTHKRRLSLTNATAQQLLATFCISPHFWPLMLGKEDFCAPLDIRTRRDALSVDRTEFICQYPRYNSYEKEEPCSVYMTYDLKEGCATYLIVGGEREEWLERSKTRLTDYFSQSASPSIETPHIKDPFLLQSILCHESLVKGQVRVKGIRDRLYNQLDFVDEFVKDLFGRGDVVEKTKELHEAAQDANSLLNRIDMGIVLAQHVERARQRVLGISPKPFPNSNVEDAIAYIVQSLGSQKRWLQSYRERMDITMTLMFNLVTQEDSKASAAIAQSTRRDSASMKTIAAMTMLYLPTTTVAGVFGMSFFDIAADGTFFVSPKFILFVEIALPLTVGTMILWWLWDSWNMILWWLGASCLRLARALNRWIEMRRRRRSKAKAFDEETDSSFYGVEI
ncbi:MAG: hypothetical protein M1825_004613 [Sarcosagium campestre]|nr:MAG: hypothetical protein M1825_004613 [Sarcosagium campestre]